MGMHYQDMCDEIRAFMVEEVELDGDQLYTSSYFNPLGAQSWKPMLLTACQTGNDMTLASAIRKGAYLIAKYPRRGKNGISYVSVPVTAPETIAESNFSRFYLRGLCRLAIGKGVGSLVGYRAMAVERPRPGSEEKIGAFFDADRTLQDLRATMNGEPQYGMPPGVGSGILARLP